MSAPVDTETAPAPRADAPDGVAALARLTRRYNRERNARQQAEKLLEEKSYELFETNKALKELNESLEQTVEQRTNDLQRALDSVRVSKQRSEHMALHDPLTSLPNRRYLRVQMDDVFERGRRNGTSIAVLHVDLDRFKQINDTMGHAAGDHVLREASRVLQELCSETDFVARIGGDEFAIVAPFDRDPGRVMELADLIPKKLSRPIEFEGRLLRFGASVGLGYDLAARTDPGKLLVNADIALYQAKDRGRGAAEVFTNELEVEMSRKKQLADEILEGIETQAFIPHYQPRICARSGRIEAVEALVRWQHPTRGLLPAVDFLAVAEDIGVLAELDHIVLQQALLDFQQWRAAGLDIPRVSVNISLRRLMEDALLDRLDALNIPPGRVSFEVVESVFLDDADAAVLGRIDAIKARGISIEIDDFGTGHASIVGVVRLRPQTIKVAGELIFDVVTSEVQAQLVKAIIDIGKSLGLHVVVEGVETKEHAAICIALGCDALQGFAYARPMPMAELAAYTRQLS